MPLDRQRLAAIRLSILLGTVTIGGGLALILVGSSRWTSAGVLFGGYGVMEIVSVYPLRHRVPWIRPFLYYLLPGIGMLVITIVATRYPPWNEVGFALTFLFLFAGWWQKLSRQGPLL